MVWRTPQIKQANNKMAREAEITDPIGDINLL